MKRWLISVCVCLCGLRFFLRGNLSVCKHLHKWGRPHLHEHSHKSKKQLGTQIGDETSPNYHHSLLSLVSVPVCSSLRWKKDKRVRGRRETDGCQKTSQSWKAEALRSCIFRCNLREDIFFLSGAPGKDELHRNLYNDCHWWQKPSPPNLLAAYGSTDEPFSLTATVSALQSDNRDSAAQQHTCRNLHTHSHSKCSPGQAHKQALFLSSKNTITHIHTRSLVSNPQKLHITKKRRASCHRPALRQERARERATHTRHRDAKSEALLLIHVSAKNGKPVGVKTLSSGVFSWQ